MAKKTIPIKIKKEIKEYIQILKTDKLPINKVILYGSYAKGKQHQWSDIDLCIISPKFKDAYCAMQYLLLKTITKPKHPIEPVGFSPKDFKDKYSSLIDEIKTTGIEIPV
ncbi:nucleotidyltransferase domain-containing protein [Patescibacteria group bacterium]|nr:nucleotidyltransferase domain-containing protein [Candidatus Falkowbacteria bacterium]MBU3906360.1 nucleotidyltransferase domain-containing protein [Patescibacteria group bacterium]MCG2698726.1 nucleotidyltransferase domain-containing protein [Candidatus Parcubacteria bacterium]MBU4014641.1 nucleotidyltransferase domain-containing protein [Patescibacteria group bacterium]MBU4026750.1 nucleotidyltransferase domain-containing protein [Patescibacteria group bacterium]